MGDAELLGAYKYQPNNEKRHAQFKGVQLVASVFLKDPARIEGLLCCHFIAMLTQVLLERDIRNAMVTRGLPELSVYPEDRACKAPTAARVLEAFTGLTRHHLLNDGRHVTTFHPELSGLQRQILDLLNNPHQRLHRPRLDRADEPQNPDEKCESKLQAPFHTAETACAR